MARRRGDGGSDPGAGDVRSPIPRTARTTAGSPGHSGSIGRRAPGAAGHAGTGDGTAAPLIPDRPSLPALRGAARGCRACPLWERGTQTVFGEGPHGAEVMLVGEQPGHEEDLAGEPFVGPAGRLLDRALAAAGLDRRAVYVTNAVKHFKWEPRGKRRIHQKPSAGEVRACHPWLEAELRVVQPRALVCLGATAAQALLGRGFKVTEHRGVPVPSPLAPLVFATIHPSSILRAPDQEARRAALASFVADLTRVTAALRTAPGAGSHA